MAGNMKGKGEVTRKISKFFYLAVTLAAIPFFIEINVGDLFSSKYPYEVNPTKLVFTFTISLVIALVCPSVEIMKVKPNRHKVYQW